MSNLRRNIEEKNLVKIIAGIDNFDIENVKKVIQAANMSGANAIDIAAREDIIEMAKEMTDLPIFVSSIKPQELLMAHQMGADALELGNYDALYKKGTRMDAFEVLELARETRSLVGEEAFISVTVPGHIDISEQIELTQNLEEIGINLIQSEGACVANVQNTGARGLLEKANVSIANTIELARNTEIPIMTASGITSTTAPMAFAAGACGIGVGSAVNKLNSLIEMAAAVRAVVEASIEAKETVNA